MTKDLVLGQVIIKRPLLGGDAYVVFGKILLPTQYPTPSPNTLRLTRFAYAVNYFTTSSQGVSLWYKKFGITAKYARCDSGTNTAAIDWKGFAAFHENNVGTGVIWDSQWPTKWLNPMIGATRYKELGDMAFVQNHVKLWTRGIEEVRLYGQIDWCEDQKTAYLAGIHYAWRTIWTQVFYDTINERMNVSLAAQF